MNLWSLGIASLWNRRFTAGLSVITIAISLILLLGVEKIRYSARDSFANTVSGADLIVGARGGALPLLLYSVFRMGNATLNISWESYQHIAKQAGVAWTIPISLGDAHRGYRVIGTTHAYFDHYRYANKRDLRFAQGKRFDDLFDVVLGAEVAAALGYELGQKIIVSHGIGNVSFLEHDDKPFRVSGILQPTGTPVDRSVHVSLEAIEAIHVDWQQGVRIPGAAISAEQVRTMRLQPKAITAFIVGLESRVGVFKLQRYVNAYSGEALSAILPGVALQELWDILRIAEQALLVVSVFVVVAAFAGMMAVSLAGLNERRREMAILRAIGAGLRHIVGLLIAESVLLTVLGLALGLFVLYLGLWALQPWVIAQYGLLLPLSLPGRNGLLMLLGFIFAGLLAGIVPAVKAYRNALADGLLVKV